MSNKILMLILLISFLSYADDSIQTEGELSEFVRIMEIDERAKLTDEEIALRKAEMEREREREREYVEEMIQLMSEDDRTKQGKGLTDVIKLQMYRENGALVGFMVKPEQNHELFEKSGLQPNDLIVAVGNTRISNIQKLMESYRYLNRESSAALEVVRDGKSLSIDVNLD